MEERKKHRSPLLQISLLNHEIWELCADEGIDVVDNVQQMVIDISTGKRKEEEMCAKEWDCQEDKRIQKSFTMRKGTNTLCGWEWCSEEYVDTNPQAWYRPKEKY